MKIGIVNPYSWDVPGGVGFHIRDLALKLRSRGHDVRVLTPSTSRDLPEWITSAGSSVSVPFNGSVANIFGEANDVTRTRRWLEENDFDVVHVHEPVVPSVSMAAAMISRAPLVGTVPRGARSFGFPRHCLGPDEALHGAHWRAYRRVRGGTAHSHRTPWW